MEQRGWVSCGLSLKIGPESDPFSTFHGHHAITSHWVTVMPSSLVSGLPLCPPSLSVLTCRLMILSVCQSAHASSAPNPAVTPISLRAEAKVLPEAQSPARSDPGHLSWSDLISPVSPLLTGLQPYQPPSCPSSALGKVLPQGLCTCCLLGS